MAAMNFIKGAAFGVITAGVAIGGLYAVSAAPVATASAPAQAGAFSVDSVHSHVGFRVKHLGTSYNYGRFNNATGSFNIDPADPAKTTIDVSVKTEDIDTANADRDKHLESPDFFSAKEFPTLSFKSKSAKKAGDNKVEITGDLLLHGKTKEITIVAEKTGEGKGRDGKPLIGLETRFTIKRSEYGMTNLIGPVADEVEITVSLEGKGQ
jgi:polyisoprenoid-binding protein YceI